MNAHARLKAKTTAALANQWGRRLEPSVSLNLPIPPSVNRLWRPSGDGGMVRSDRYRTWWQAAGNALNVQRPGRVEGDYALTMTVNRGKTKADIGNLEKACSDLLQHYGVIENDRRAVRITLEWSPSVEECQVMVEGIAE